MSYEQYYARQAGNGIIGYSGVRYQKGNGFFVRLMSGAVLPWIKKSMKFLAKNALNAGANIGADLISSNDFSKENIKDVSKKRLKEQGTEMANKALKSVLGRQRGEGRKKRKRRTKTKKECAKTVSRKLIKGKKTSKIKKKGKVNAGKKKHNKRKYKRKATASDFLNL